MPAPILLFDRFELRPAQRRLLRDGEPVTLRTRAFDLLLVLVGRAGAVVTKSELLDLVWPGVVVEENNIAAQVVALRKALGGDLIATVPGRGYRFTGEITSSTPAPAMPAATVAAPSAFASTPQRLFGRDDDLARLEAAVASSGCVTLVGPGGVGKTVLTRALAAQRAVGKTVWVDLAALSDGTQIEGALGRALGIAAPASPADATAALAAALASGAWLLIFDNAEHLIDAVASLAVRLLNTASSLTLLVTSQLPLRIAGERVQPLEPLSLASTDFADVKAFDSAAVQLLANRIRTADPRFALDADSGPLLHQLCVRLDGLPLALEMAGAIAPVLGLQGVLAAIERRFDALKRGHRDAPARQRTLRAALEWSHALLVPIEQRMFRRLGVFAGDFSPELAIAAVAEPDDDRWDTIELLSDLVDRSLVASLHTDPPRYRLLETMRSFAIEQLGASGEADAARLRAMRALTALMEANKDGGPQAAAELANVPELLNWARGNAPAAAIDLTLAACAIATWTPWLGEASRWIEACEPLLDDRIAPTRQAAWWREMARFQTFVRGPRTVEAARKACEIERALGDAHGLFWSLVPLLRSRVLTASQFEVARQEAQGLIDAHPEWPARARVILSGSLAMEYRRLGDFESAWVHQQAEADQAERAGLHHIADNAQSNLSATLVGLGRHEEALARLQTLMRRSGDVASPVNAHNRVQMLNALVGLGRLDDALAFAPEALDWCMRYDVLDIYQVLAHLAALTDRPRAATTFLVAFRQQLAERGAELPDDAHAFWREAVRLTGVDMASLDALMARQPRLDLAAAVQLLTAQAD